MTHLDALRFLAACLRAGESDAMAAVPTQLEWEKVLEIAAQQRIMPALPPLARLCEAEPDLLEDLRWIAELNSRRNRAALGEIESILLCCNELGVEPALLKGSARLAAGSENILASRYLGDLDLLVPPERIAQLAGALKQVGYYSVPYDAQDHPLLKHYPRLINPHRTFPVELHRALGEVSWRHILPPQEALAGSQPAKLGAAKCRLLCGKHAIVHSIIHSQLDNRGHWLGELSLTSMNDCISIMKAEVIDWASVHPTFARRGLAAVSRNFESWIRCLFEGAEAPDGASPSPLDGDLVRHISYPVAWSRWYADQILASPAARRRIQEKVLSPQRWLSLSGRIAKWFVRLASLRNAGADDRPALRRLRQRMSHS